MVKLKTKTIKKGVFISFLMCLVIGGIFAQSDGPIADYYDNGKKKFQGQLQNGSKVGNWVFYHESGKKKAEGLYINGQKSGEWITYDAGGRKRTQGAFERTGSVRAQDL